MGLIQHKYGALGRSELYDGHTGYVVIIGNINGN